MKAKIEAIEEMVGGPVAAARLCGVSYVSWWRWKTGAVCNERARITIDLLHKSLLTKKHPTPPAGQADSPPKVPPEAFTAGN